MSPGTKLVARGIVLGGFPSGEGSVRVRIYTDQAGLISAHAKSAREERSQLRAHLEPATYGHFSLVKGKDVWRVTGISGTKNAHFALAGNAEAERSLARVISFVRQFVRGEGSDPYLFAALWDFVTALPKDAALAKDAECATVLKILAVLGYVEDTERIAPFLNRPYGPELLRAVGASRAPLLKVINEGISASGLS